MRYFIVDDDTASRKMLAKIITEGELGSVIGEAESGVKSLPLINSTNPDFILIDLLMPELDGIETMEQIRRQGFQGQFIMISQIVNKEMVGEAYEKGVEFFIHKPINRVEVLSILKKLSETSRLRKSLLSIRESLAHIGTPIAQPKRKNIKEIVLALLNDLGIIGEPGSEDMVLMMEHLMDRKQTDTQFPPLKDLYETVASLHKTDDIEIKKESKSIEQRIRRTILTAVTNFATLGLIDYMNPKFEYYASRYFEFEEIRRRMKEIDENSNELTKVKINIKKFLQVMYLDTAEKHNQS